MTRSICLLSGCPQYAVHRGRCAAHRESTTERGYGAGHQEARAALAATLPAPCGYGCGSTLTADAAWVAAHVVDGDASAGWVAACVTCNERAKHEALPIMAAPHERGQSPPEPRGWFV